MAHYDYTFVHCLFEQTRTFSKAVSRYGSTSSLCYDIAGDPDVKVDIFHEIDKCYQGMESMFDNIAETDLVLAFFPCTYFSGFNKPMVSMSSDISQYKRFKPMERAKIIANRVANFAIYYGYICKLIGIAQKVGFHLIIENPEHVSFLHDFTPCDNFIIDADRSLHGDAFKKPTFYFYVNRPVPFGFSNYNEYEPRMVKKAICNISGAGDHTLNRSLITDKYADWFVKNCIYDEFEETPLFSAEIG